MQYGRTRLGARVRRAVVGLTAAAAVAGAVATTGLVGAAPAGADVPDWEAVEALGDYNSNISRETIAECSPGLELIGTGAVMVGNSGTMIESITPDLTNDRVVATAFETPLGNANSWRLKAYAVCAEPGAFGTTYLADDTVSVGAGAPREASTRAECDPGDSALAVGFDTAGPRGRLLPSSLIVEDEGAYVEVDEDVQSLNLAWDMTAYAICADGPAPAEVTVVNSGTSRADCVGDDMTIAAGASVVGGLSGYSTIFTMKPSEYFDFYSAYGGIREMTATVNDSGLQTYAVCADLP